MSSAAGCIHMVCGLPSVTNIARERLSSSTPVSRACPLCSPARRDGLRSARLIGLDASHPVPDLNQHE
eukprot:7174591-Prymnesium_polylepis.3